MFARRVRIILLLLALPTLLLVGRAAQVQIFDRAHWKREATEAMKMTLHRPSARGKIMDRKGRLLATDKPCIDACIEYRALTDPPDPEWIKARAMERLKARMGDSWTSLPGKQKVELRKAEIEAVKADIDHMWAKLAHISGRSMDEIEQTRNAIVSRVQMRQRYVCYARYEQAIKKTGSKLETADWKKWLTDGGSDAIPAMEAFHITVQEELEPHVILPAIDADVQNALGRDIDQFPGLMLRPGTHRAYPYDDVGCHILGHLAHVDTADLKSNKKIDELRNYLRNDLIGKTGAEALCEPALRGTRGQTDRALGEDLVLANKEPIPGQDVRLSIDIELQQAIQAAFASAKLRNAAGAVTEEDAVLHGAVVVLDVKTNEVLALVSYPTYDPNQFDQNLSAMQADEINDPLRNRATMSQFEPGSTVKTACGLAAISQGVVGVNEGIECLGLLHLDGHIFRFGRCWVEKFRGQIESTEHHPIPYASPHVGHDGNKNGFLTYSDALERSCNVYFETVADRLGIDRLSEWYERFGLGRPTGIGIGEVKGRLPRDFPVNVPSLRRSTGFLGGIGQGCIAATPIQMANLAAMIARNGVWMRPVLVLPGPDGQLPPLRPGAWQNLPDQVDLKVPAGKGKPLSAQALEAARLGMFNVVNSKAGTGTALIVGDDGNGQPDPLLKSLHIAGKTGTAQAARFSVPLRDPLGKPVLDANKHVKRTFIEPSLPGHPNPAAPWYRGTLVEVHDKVHPEVVVSSHLELNHAWFIGFVPVEHPQVAFAVMVEYGGSGGVAAASVARETLGACIARGYLQKPRFADK